MSARPRKPRPPRDRADRRADQVVRPYGDTTGDGMVQVSFTLPLPHDKRAEGAACSWPRRWASTRPCRARQGDGAGLHVLRRLRPGQPPGRHRRRSRWSSATTRCSPPKEVNAAIKKRLRRRLVVVGACIGTDAHTVGIDAILNIKGFAGEKGLEYYRELKVVNLGAQVAVPELVAPRPRGAGRRRPGLPGRDPARRAPAQHPQMSAAFREAYPADRRPLLVVGGPRFDEGASRPARRGPDLRQGHHTGRGRDAIWCMPCCRRRARAAARSERKTA